MKKVCFVSLSRSDYSSLMPVIKAALKDSEIEVDVVAGGSHNLERFGKSIDKFKQDEIPVNKNIDFFKEDDDSDEDMAISFGRAYAELTDYFIKSKPDCIFLLGDRWEILAAANSASFLRIPIIHHSGGDLTQGSLDNQTRYALTTQSHLHLVALEEHRERLLCVGEEDWRVVTVGEPALTMIKEYGSDVSNIREELGLAEGTKFCLATFHPTTFDSEPRETQLEVFLNSLDLIEQEIVLTAPNPDPGSNSFYNSIVKYSQSKPNVHLYENLGARRYYATMSEAEFMIGNSSSGIWEAPSFQLPVLNIGHRQADRLRAENVIDVDLNIESVKDGLEKLNSNSFKASLKSVKNPYVQDNTNELILDYIKKDYSNEKLLAKVFIDPVNK